MGLDLLQVFLSHFILCWDCFLVHYVLMSSLNDLHRASSLIWGFRFIIFNSKFSPAAVHAGNEEVNKTIEESCTALTFREMLFCASLSLDISYIRTGRAWGENIMWHLTSSVRGSSASWINIILVCTLSEYTRDKLLLTQVNFKLIAHHLQPPSHSEQITHSLIYIRLHYLIIWESCIWHLGAKLTYKIFWSRSAQIISRMTQSDAVTVIFFTLWRCLANLVFA